MLKNSQTSSKYNRFSALNARLSNAQQLLGLSQVNSNSRTSFDVKKCFKNLKQAHPFYHQLNYIPQKQVKSTYLFKQPMNEWKNVDTVYSGQWKKVPYSKNEQQNIQETSNNINLKQTVQVQVDQLKNIERGSRLEKLLI